MPPASQASPGARSADRASASSVDDRGRSTVSSRRAARRSARWPWPPRRPGASASAVTQLAARHDGPSRRRTAGPARAHRAPACTPGRRCRRRRGRRPATARRRPACPTSSEPISSSRPRQRAPPIVASRSAWRTVSASGPPRSRADSSAWCSSSIIRPGLVGRRRRPRRARPARPPRAARGTGAMPGAEPAVGGRAVRDAGAGRGEPARRLVRQVHAVRQPHVRRRASPRSSTYWAGVRPKVCRQNSSSSSGLGQVGVQPHARPAGPASALSRISSAVTENGEHGATAIRIIAPNDGIVPAVDRRLGRGQDLVVLLDHAVRGQPAGRLRRGSSTRGRVEAQPDLAAPRRSRPPSRSPRARREDVVVVGARGAAGQGQPAQVGRRGRVHQLRRPARPRPGTAWSASRTACASVA